MVTYITFLGWIPESDDKQRKKSSISKLNLEDGKLPLLLVFFFFLIQKEILFLAEAGPSGFPPLLNY